MYKGFLEKCFISEIMREYLKDIDLRYYAVDIIMYAPIPIEVKNEELKKVIDGAKGSLSYNGLKHECRKAIMNIELARRYLDQDGVFSVEYGQFIDSEKDTSCGFDTICADYYDVKDYMNQFIPYEKDEIIYFMITKWVKDSEGKFVEACDYYIAHGEILYIMPNNKLCGLSGTVIYESFIQSEKRNGKTDEIELFLSIKSR